MARFTTNHETIEEWLEEHLEDTPYRRRIIRMHHLYPDATLSQLRGHPSKGEQSLYWIKLRKASPEAICQFTRLAEKYAELTGFQLDEKGHKITWRRPKDEPV